MVYETSYESGRKPFRPDVTRGYWSNPSDFIYAGVGLAFKLDMFSVSSFFIVQCSVVSTLPYYLFCLALYLVPLMVIQCFMGQFSSSGFISAFRLAPLFKGIGYVSLALNLCVLTYYSVFATIPLMYFLNSMRPTLPWSCEGFKTWASNITEEEKINLCNLRISGNNMTDPTDNSTLEEQYDYVNHHIPSVLYFKSLFNDLNLFFYEDNGFFMSWELALCSLLVWSIIAFILTKCTCAEKFGTLLRYTVWTVLSLLVVCVVRFSFLPGSGAAYKRFFVPPVWEWFYGFTSMPVLTMAAFGPGWGSLISLSSFNKFRTNIMRSSWLIGLGQMAVFLALGLLSHLTERYFKEVTEDNYYNYMEHHWILFLSSGSVMAQMRWANFWSMLFFAMLTLAALFIMVVQLYCIFVSIFDEFEILRSRRSEVIYGTLALLAFFSLYFASNHGILYFTALSVDSLFTQTAINLLLLLVVLWVYGRMRFQRDIEFMLGQRFSTWKVNILRFVAPACLLLTLLISIFVAIFEHMIASRIILVAAIFFILIPWLCIPGYAIVSVCQTTGSLGLRLKRCCRPTDWYPVDSDDRQRYEEAVGNLDITHQLNEMTEEVL